MRRLFSAVLLMLCFAPGVQAQENAIEGVIASQIEAFRTDDFARAFQFAAPNIQGIFGTPGKFGRMVREGYPMVWRPADVRFVERHAVEGGQVQIVRIVDQAVQVHLLAYLMGRTADGWRIAGVHLLPAPVPAV